VQQENHYTKSRKLFGVLFIQSVTNFSTRPADILAIFGDTDAHWHCVSKHANVRHCRIDSASD
jgi:hypothetical protein